MTQERINDIGTGRVIRTLRLIEELIVKKVLLQIKLLWFIKILMDTLWLKNYKDLNII